MKLFVLSTNGTAIQISAAQHFEANFVQAEGDDCGCGTKQHITAFLETDLVQLLNIL